MRADRNVHVAAKLHVIPGRAERSPEEEEAQAHLKRGRVLEAIQRESKEDLSAARRFKYRVAVQQ